MNRTFFATRTLGFALLAGLPLVILAGKSAAATELVQNGSFESTLIPGSYEFGGLYPTQQVTGWTTSGYNFVFNPGSADSPGATGTYGNLQLWGPKNGSANGLTASSPDGGNFIGADGAYQVDAISQLLTGLTPGASVIVTFYWGAAQQAGYRGLTTEQWAVSLGGDTQKTAVMTDPDQGFSPWVKQSFTFTAHAASATLSFLATGTPSGEPPFALLDGVSATMVPEPGTWTTLLTGLLGVAGLSRLRRKSSVAGDAAT